MMERGTEEWDAVWRGLANEIRRRGLGDGTDLTQVNPRYGEVWQYMGSALGGVYQFRHRAHPTKDQRIYLEVEPMTWEELESNFPFKVVQR